MTETADEKDARKYQKLRNKVALKMMAALVTADWYDRMTTDEVARHAYLLTDAYLDKRSRESYL